MTNLTKRQWMVLDFIRVFIEANEYPPTLREIGEYMGIGSTNGVNDHLCALEMKGAVERDRRVARGIRLTPLGRGILEAEIAARRLSQEVLPL